MAFDPSTARPVQPVGGGFDPSTAQPVGQQPQPSATEQAVEDVGFVNAASETAGFLGESALNYVESGLKGLYELAVTQDPELATQKIKEVQAGLDPSQLSQRSQEQLASIGGAAEEVGEAASEQAKMVSGIFAGIAQGDPEAGAEFGRRVQEQGLGETMGDIALEVTQSPVLATMAYSTPTAIMELYGLKGGSRVAKGVPQSKTKQEIGRLLQEGAIDTRTAKWQLEGGKVVEGGQDLIETAPERFADSLKSGSPRIKKDKTAIKALDQGWGEDAVAIAKGVNAETKSKMLQMVQKQKELRTKPLDKTTQRASDVAGESVVNRFNHVLKVNKDTGKELNKVAKGLEGKNVNLQDSYVNFFNELGEELGVYVDNDFSPSFTGSIIEDSPGNQEVLKTVLRRLQRLEGEPDALQAHRLKKYIDEQVTFGKTRTDKPLSAKTESILKKLRADVDGALDTTFPEYDKVNSIYAETVQALDNLQGAAGKKIDLSGDGANQATGTLLRGLMSNNRGRMELTKSINELDTVANRYGGNFNDDILAQVAFADELDRVFGTAAKTSFKGDIDTAIKLNTPDKGMIKKGFEKVGTEFQKLKFNEDKAIESMENLLSK